MAEILAAGEWRSPAFLKYLNMHRLQEDLRSQQPQAESAEGAEQAAALPPLEHDQEQWCTIIHGCLFCERVTVKATRLGAPSVR